MFGCVAEYDAKSVLASIICELDSISHEHPLGDLRETLGSFVDSLLLMSSIKADLQWCMLILPRSFLEELFSFESQRL